jgi:hypothetical protein
MSRALWIGLGALAGLAVAGAGLAAWQLREEAPDEPTKPAAKSLRGDKRPAARAATGGPVEERIARLERKVSLLERQRDMARLLGAAGGDDDGDGDAGANTVDDPVFEMAVRDIVERVGDERAREESQRRLQRMERWSQRWTDDIAVSLGLNDAQKTKVLAAVKEHFEATVRAREGAEGADAGSPRERRRTMREALDKRLAGVLTPTQMRELAAKRESGELPGFGGARRGRRD